MRRTVVALLLGLIVGTLYLLSPLAAPAMAADDGAEHQFLDLLNAERSKAGLALVSVRPEVTPVARTWTAKLIRDGALSHNPNLADQMPSDWTRIGENVGYGPTVDAVHTAFMNSAGHRANILGDYTQVGIGADRDGSGRIFVTVDFMKGSPTPQVVAAAAPSGPAMNGVGACAANQNPAGPANKSGATGYYVLGSDGGIFAYGNAPYHGSAPAQGLHIDAVLMTLTPSQDGYWVAGRDGGIFSYGDAEFFGSVPGLHLGAPVTAIDLKPTPSGKGYWILGKDGGIFSFGDAAFFGSLPGIGVRNTAVRLIPTPSGKGYWILGADGGIFSFGDATFFGSVPGIGVRATGVSMARSIAGAGYWILGADGGIFSFGDARFFGSVPGLGMCDKVTGIQLSPTVSGGGYYIVSDHGRVFNFGDAPSLGEPAGLGMIARDIQAVRL
jgi:hypothetical protein